MDNLNELTEEEIDNKTEAKIEAKEDLLQIEGFQVKDRVKDLKVKDYQDHDKAAKVLDKANSNNNVCNKI